MAFTNGLTRSEKAYYLLQYLRKVITYNVFFLIIMSLFRCIFVLTYGKESLSDSAYLSDLARALFLGIRFDSTVLGYIQAIPTLAMLALLALPLSEKNWLFILKLQKNWMLIWFCIVSFILAVDLGYYSYFQDHINILVFGFIEDDTTALVKTMWKNYPVIRITFAAILFVWGLAWVGKKIFATPKFPMMARSVPAWTIPAISLVMVIAVFLVGRGSLGLFPLGPADTVISRNVFINHVAYNGVHSFYRALSLRQHQLSAWDANWHFYRYNSAEDGYADYFQKDRSLIPNPPELSLKQVTPKNDWAAKHKPHVVLIVMESFASNWIRYDSPAFNLMGELSRHFKEDFYFPNFLPSTPSTIGSLGSLLISAPTRPIGPFLTESKTLQVPFRTSPALNFEKYGYETRYIYGGNPGWRDVNKFAYHQGFDHIEGDVDISEVLGGLKETHDWGVYDEDVFAYVSKILTTATKPQMILVMTTANHPPYQLPSYAKVPDQIIPDSFLSNLVVDKDLATKRFKCYYHSNNELGKWLTQIKESHLGQKTIIGVTGDHSFHIVNYKAEELLDKWSVPFYVYVPKELREQKIISWDQQRYGAHMDIFPTLYDLSLSESEVWQIGKSLFAHDFKDFGIHSDRFVLDRTGGVLIRSHNENTYFERLQTGELKVSAETPELINQSKRFKGLMTAMDHFFEVEYQNSKKVNSSQPQ